MPRSWNGPLRLLARSRSLIGRLTWGLADQGISSITNFAVSAVVARSLGVDSFGTFSLAFVTYAFVLNLSRGLTTDPLTVRFSSVAEAEWRGAVRIASGTSIVIGLAAGGVCAAVGLAVGGRLGSALVALGVVLPGLLLQDAWRFAFFAAGQGRQAFLNDAIWAISLVPALYLAHQAGNVFDFVLAWGLAGGVAACCGILQARVVPTPSGARRWIGQQVDLGPRYMIANLCGATAEQIRMYSLGAIAGLAAVGAVRGAVVVFGPFHAVLMGLSLVVVPEAARILRHSPHRLLQFCALLAAGQGVVALSWGLSVRYLVPDAAGEFALGEVWAAAAVLLLPVTFEVVAAGVATSAAAGLRALGAAGRSLRTQLFSSSSYVVGGVSGAFLGGALGSAWGVAIGSAVSTGVWWYQLRAGYRQHTRTAPKGVTRTLESDTTVR